MYVGPWQEYKLARILQLKQQIDQEAEQANKIIQPQHPKQ